MKVISAVGGGGSTFIVNELEKANFASTLPGTYAYKIFGRLLSVEPRLVQGYLVGLKLFGLYKPKIHVLRRPDAFGPISPIMNWPPMTRIIPIINNI